MWGPSASMCAWALRASGHGDPVQASMHGPGACMCGPGACVRAHPVRVCGRGSSRHGHGHAGIQRARIWACGDPARTMSSSSRVPGSIQHVKK